MPTEFNKGAQRSDSASADGPNPYNSGSGRPTVRLTDLVAIGSADDVDAAAYDTSSGGTAYEAAATSVNGNAVSVAVYDVQDPATTSGADAAMDEVASGTDLSSVTIRVDGRGY